MQKEKTILQSLSSFHPGFSVDCVVVTYHEKKIKILINRYDKIGQWMLPGGFVRKDEDVDQAVHRILKARTGLGNIYLQQFRLFGSVGRTDLGVNKKILDILNDEPGKRQDYESFYVNRFITMGYYALVNFEKIRIPGKYSHICKWFSLDDLPELYSDHRQIIDKAIQTIRFLIKYLPIGSQMLPEKFTLPDLRVIYEGLLGKKLDRRNFQKKMLSSGLIERLEKCKDVKTYPHSYYYRFNKQTSELKEIESLSIPISILKSVKSL